MTRVALAGVLTLVLAGTSLAQCCNGAATAPAGIGGLLGTLNAPLVPGMAAVPGMPTPSVLGLISPRLSLASGFLQAGGFTGPNALQYGVGFAAPRLAPVLALQAGTLQPTQAVLGVLAPRAALGVQLVQGLGTGGGIDGGRLFGRRGCR